MPSKAKQKEFRTSSFELVITKENGDQEIYNKNKNLWLSISNNKLFYLSWENGRLYFFLDKLNKDSQVRNLKLDSINQTLSFEWIGDWEVDEPQFNIIKVHDYYLLRFSKEKEYANIEKIINII